MHQLYRGQWLFRNLKASRSVRQWPSSDITVQCLDKPRHSNKPTISLLKSLDYNLSTSLFTTYLPSICCPSGCTFLYIATMAPITTKPAARLVRCNLPIYDFLTPRFSRTIPTRALHTSPRGRAVAEAATSPITTPPSPPQPESAATSPNPAPASKPSKPLTQAQRDFLSSAVSPSPPLPPSPPVLSFL